MGNNANCELIDDEELIMGTNLYSPIFQHPLHSKPYPAKYKEHSSLEGDEEIYGGVYNEIDYDTFHKSITKSIYDNQVSIRSFFKKSIIHRNSFLNDSQIELTTGEVINISIDLDYFNKVIENSKYILDLQPDWDDENALQILPSVWDKAVRFMLNYVQYIYNYSGIKISTPSIDPCRDGSIDLSWRTQTARLLINIKDNELASYYGDNYNGINGIEGFVELKQVQEFLATWMRFLV